MDPFAIINKYYTQGTPLYDILVTHSRRVAEKALEIARKHPELKADEEFLYEAAMLHDIGIYLTNAPDIECFGSRPYICHGSLGSELLKNEALPRPALVCERHTGAGLSLDDILHENLPIPHRDMLPISMEEQIICYSDKFYTKSDPGREKTPEQIQKSLSKYGEAAVKRFEQWDLLFSSKIY